MTTISLTTELEAINALLAAAGESRIDSLEATGFAEVAAAKAKLDEVSREVQQVGWVFNTEERFPLTRDLSGFITLPGNVLKLVITSAPEVIQRGTKLYDKQSHSYKHSKDHEGTIVFLLSWNELPQSARHYIMVKAARMHQMETFGSDSLYAYSEKQEAEALKAFQETEGETGQYNMFSDSESVAGILRR